MSHDAVERTASGAPADTPLPYLAVDGATVPASAPHASARRRRTRAGDGARDAKPESWRALGAEALLLTVLLAAPWAYGGAPDSARFALAAVTLLGLACAAPSLLDALRPREAHMPPTAWWQQPLAVRASVLPLLALAQVLSARSAAPLASLEAALLLTMGLGVCVYWSVRATRRGAAWRLASVLLVSCLAQAVFGAIQQALAPGSLYGRSAPTVTMPYGSYVNHNHFAGLMMIGALLAAGLAWGHARQARQATPLAVALGGLALALSATLLASRSRGGLLALLFGLAVLGACLAWLAPGVTGSDVASQRQAVPRRGLRACGVALVLVLFVGGFAWAVVPPETRSHLLSVLTGTRDSSRGYRIDVAIDTLRLWWQRPLFGWGLGAFPDAFPAVKRGHGELRTTHAESDALEFLAEAGLAGFAGLAWLLLLVARRLGERLNQGHDMRLKGLAAGTLAALAAQAVHLCVDFDLRLPANALAVSALLGLAATGRQARRTSDAADQPEVPPAPPGTPRQAVLLTLALAALAGASGWRAWGAWALEQQAHLPVARQLAALDRVVRWHPYLAEARRARARAWLAQVRATRPESTARLGRAERDLRAAVALRPRWGEAWAELALVSDRRGELAAARTAADRAITYDPTHTGIGIARARLLGRHGEHAAALDQLRASMAFSQEFRWPEALGQALQITREATLLLRLAGNDARRREDVLAALAPLVHEAEK